MNENQKLTKELHSSNFRKFGIDVNLGTVITALALITLFFGYVFYNRQHIFTDIENLRDSVISVLGVPMIGVMLVSFLLVIVISLSPLGKIVIGGKQAQPEFKRFSWYAMLFGAGMGIGFMFWGVAEPLFHNDFTPIFASDSAKVSSIATSIYHWGLFPWAIYALVSLALAFYAYNLKLPLAPRSMFYPILREKIYGKIGDVIDGIAVVVTLFSLASSLGFGALQVNAGFNYLFGTSINANVQIIIIIFVTIMATLSLVTGLDKGIRILSESNIILATVLVVAFFILGDTFDIFKTMFESVGVYLSNIISVNFVLPQVAETTKATIGYDWTASWTIFYWAWWIGWTIFVGMFIAKISYGRSIRDFLLSVMVIPTLIAIVWFTVFGATAIDINAANSNELFNIVSQNEALSLYALIDLFQIPQLLKIILNVISIILIISFFVTSSDSGSMVVDGLTSAGSPDEPLGQKIFWAALEGVLAIFLIIIGGQQALEIIQMVLIIIAGPFSLLVITVLVLLVFELIVIYKKNYRTEES